jgi:hypothetical protein
MAIERKWLAVVAQPFTADGTQFGVVTVADTAGFKVKQLIFLAKTLGPPLQLQVKRVLSSTKLVVGPPDNKISIQNYADISAFTVLSGASIAAPEQDKNNIPDKDHYTAIYEADPTVADRVILVDQYGNFYSNTNPIPIIFEGTVTITEVEVVGENGNTIEPNADGSINVVVVTAPVAGHAVKSFFNEVAAIASGATTTLVSYTVPAGKTAILERIDTSGENVARYDILVNSVLFDTKRTMFGSDLNADFDYTTGSPDGLIFIAGDIIKVQVLHSRPMAATFEARIQVLEIS